MASRRRACPMLVLWGEKGGLTRFDVLAEWRARANDVRGKALPGTHWLPEQLPAETLAELGAFLPSWQGTGAAKSLQAA